MSSTIPFEHVSRTLSEFYDVPQSQGKKPVGLWLSAPGVWAKWERPTYSWVCRAEVPTDHFFAWTGGLRPPTSPDPQRRILRIDMSDEPALSSLIDAYRAAGKRYDIDWARMASSFDGIHFTCVDRVPNYFVKYNDWDGCWINSISVDSMCMWVPSSLGTVTWVKKRGRGR
jgi:hypothetical protein